MTNLKIYPEKVLTLQELEELYSRMKTKTKLPQAVHYAKAVVCQLTSSSKDFIELASELDRVGLDVQRTGLDPALLESPVVQPMPSPSTPEGLLSPIFSPTSQKSFPFMPFAIPKIIPLPDQVQIRLNGIAQHVMGNGDATSKVYDQLSEAKHWWILENIPTLTMYQESNGDWTRKRM